MDSNIFIDIKTLQNYSNKEENKLREFFLVNF